MGSSRKALRGDRSLRGGIFEGPRGPSPPADGADVRDRGHDGHDAKPAAEGPAVSSSRVIREMTGAHPVEARADGLSG
ncbi:hypothetical protein SAMN06265360_104177 [Haloechinothrix alba]|uniref:Uncharacterized protein n=1 Tax=Haloechinothrix alba TaxID=664784 RepID=A0A238VX17_9PSEU|nr:hypothetical protein SAMN06265360_104177 [Haloechinothrix alba]